MPNAYARTNIDLVFTKSKKALLSYTTLRIHPFNTPKNLSTRQALINILRLSKNWFKLFYIPFYTRKITNLNGSAALLTRNVGDCYGHFITEVMMGLYQIRLSKKMPDFYILPQNYSFQKELPKMLGINESQIIPANKNHLIFAQELIIPTLLNEYEIIEYRKHTHFRILYQPSLVKYLYTQILSQSWIPRRKIFFTRPKNSNRNIINHNEVEAVFKEFGFEIVLPDSLSIQKQIELMQECKILAGMHGSSLANSIFLNKHATLFELFSEYYHDNHPHFIALAKECKYFYMIGKTPDTSMHPQQENTYIEPNILRKALENIKKYVEF